jgi:hypothetical protein
MSTLKSVCVSAETLPCTHVSAGLPSLLSYFSTSPLISIAATTQVSKQSSHDPASYTSAETDPTVAFKGPSVQMQESLRKADLSVSAVMSILKGAAHGEGRAIPHSTGVIIQRVQELQKAFGKVMHPTVQKRRGAGECTACIQVVSLTWVSV